MMIDPDPYDFGDEDRFEGIHDYVYDEDDEYDYRGDLA